MSLVRWDPMREFEDVSNRLNRLFSTSMLGSTMTTGAQEMTATPDWSPTVDVIETPEDYQIKLELPEVRRDDVRLSVMDGVLRVEGERKSEKEERGRRYHRIERQYGSFSRAFSLPDNVDAARIHADFKDGVLRVAMPKTAATAHKAMTIKIS